MVQPNIQVNSQRTYSRCTIIYIKKKKKIDEMGHLHLWLDEMGLDEMGLDEMGLDEMG